MNSSDAFEISDVPLIEWLTARRVRANLLVLSEAISVETIGKVLTRWFPAPASVTTFPGELRTPAHRAGTWFLLGVAALTMGQQHELDRWITGEGRGVQIVSISAEPLWPLVGTGQFLDRLYYRLNTIMLDARPMDGRSNYDEGSGATRP